MALQFDILIDCCRGSFWVKGTKISYQYYNRQKTQ